MAYRRASVSAHRRTAKKGKKFFSEEKNQKTFDCWRGGLLPGLADQLQQAKQSKVFWFFSSEKNMLSIPSFQPAA
jgi:hypothetical protein